MMTHWWEFWDWFDDWVPWVVVGCGALLALSMIGFVWAAIAQAHDPQIHLNKRHWHCTETRTSLMPQVMIVGKLVMTTLHPVTRCVTYQEI